MNQSITIAEVEVFFVDSRRRESSLQEGLVVFSNKENCFEV